MFRQVSGFQIDADGMHDDVRNHTEQKPDQGDQDNGEKRELDMALVLEVPPPFKDTRKPPRIRDDDHGRRFFTGREHHFRKENARHEDHCADFFPKSFHPCLHLLKCLLLVLFSSAAFCWRLLAVFTFETVANPYINSRASSADGFGCPKGGHFFE